jgi:hypothetical protein
LFVRLTDLLFLQIDSLDEFLNSIQESFPNLKYLSMLKNPCCPNYFVGKDSQAYQKYRYQFPIQRGRERIFTWMSRRYPVIARDANSVCVCVCRYVVLSRIKTLKFLDSTPVTSAEREQAINHAKRIARPDPSQVSVLHSLVSLSLLCCYSIFALVLRYHGVFLSLLIYLFICVFAVMQFIQFKYERKAPEIPIDESKGLDTAQIGKIAVLYTLISCQ